MNQDAEDRVDRIRAQWATERPELDTRPMGVIGRMRRTSAAIDVRLRAVFAEYGIGDGDFDLLATLRRAGAPHRLSPSQLADTMMVTSGAVTKRIDRLERIGLVTRTPCADDARARTIELTPAGRALVDQAVVAHLANEERILSSLSQPERDQLALLLKKLLLSLDE